MGRLLLSIVDGAKFVSMISEVPPRTKTNEQPLG
jgi:hypothetical protein